MKVSLCALFITIFIAQCTMLPLSKREFALTEDEARLAHQLHDVTQKYLDEHVAFLSQSGKAFSRFEVCGVEEADGIIHEYVWYYFSEYVVKDGRLVSGSGASLPVALTVRRAGDSFIVEGHKEPVAGELDMFPQKLRTALRDYSAPREREEQVRRDAMTYYHLH